MVTAQVSQDFNRALTEYIRGSSRTQDEILAKKGNDLRLKLFKGFFARKWQGGKTIPFREFKARAKAGKGIRVRQSIRSGGIGFEVPFRNRKGRALNDRQRRVYLELKARSRGIGVLGATFIEKRWRWRKAGRYLALNKTNRVGAPMLSLTKQPETFQLVGWTPGLTDVDEKYGIVRNAMDTIRREMVKHTIERYKKSADKVFKRFLR